MEPADDEWLANDATASALARDVPRAASFCDPAARVHAVAAPAELISA